MDFLGHSKSLARICSTALFIFIGLFFIFTLFIYFIFVPSAYPCALPSFNLIFFYIFSFLYIQTWHFLRLDLRQMVVIIIPGISHLSEFKFSLICDYLILSFVLYMLFYYTPVIGYYIRENIE